MRPAGSRGVCFRPGKGIGVIGPLAESRGDVEHVAGDRGPPGIRTALFFSDGAGER